MMVMSKLRGTYQLIQPTKYCVIVIEGVTDLEHIAKAYGAVFPGGVAATENRITGEKSQPFSVIGCFFVVPLDDDGKIADQWKLYPAPDFADRVAPSQDFYR